MVAIVDDGVAVRNKYYGVAAVGEQVAQQRTLGVGVEGTGGLVEQHDAAGAQQGACDGDALGLSLGESCAVLGHDGVESLGQGIDKVGAHGT